MVAFRSQLLSARSISKEKEPGLLVNIEQACHSAPVFLATNCLAASSLGTNSSQAEDWTKHRTISSTELQ